jgi:hypothetical protein
MGETRSERRVATNGAAVEVGVIVHEGREFRALGSVVDHESGRVVGYVKGDKLVSWDGKVTLGTIRVVSTWRTPRSWVSSKMSSYRAVVGGKSYHGRGCGDGFLLKLKKSR